MPCVTGPGAPGIGSSTLVASATIRPSRSGVLPWLKMMTASAPACSAYHAFVPKKQVPRWISAMSASPLQSMPAKSAASQPLVDARSPVRLMSTGMTWPSTAPEPLPVKTPVSYVGLDRCQLPQHRREVERDLDRVERHLVAGLPQQARDVLDAVRVAVGAGRAGARVDRVVAVVGDLLELRLVLPDALQRHALQELLVRVVRLLGRTRCPARRPPPTPAPASPAPARERLPERRGPTPAPMTRTASPSGPPCPVTATSTRHAPPAESGHRSEESRQAAGEAAPPPAELLGSVVA